MEKTTFSDTKIRVADEVWFGTAILQRENFKKNPEQEFSVREIVQKIVERFGKYPWWTLRPGVIVHINLHCVANRQPNPNTLCYLFETRRGKRRLFKGKKDQPHEWRKNGRQRPEKSDIPLGISKGDREEFEKLIDWYDGVYNK